MASFLEPLGRHVLHVVLERALEVAGVDAPLDLRDPWADSADGPTDRRLPERQPVHGEPAIRRRERDGAARGVAAEHGAAPGHVDERLECGEFAVEADAIGRGTLAATEAVVDDRRDALRGRRLGRLLVHGSMARNGPAPATKISAGPGPPMVEGDPVAQSCRREIAHGVLRSSGQPSVEVHRHGVAVVLARRPCAAPPARAPCACRRPEAGGSPRRGGRRSCPRPSRASSFRSTPPTPASRRPSTRRDPCPCGSAP